MKATRYFEEQQRGASWPGLSRPSTRRRPRQMFQVCAGGWAWMPGTRPGMTRRVVAGDRTRNRS